MELSEALRTTGAVRDFTDDPVEPAVITEILDEARFAPSGGNRQGWRVAVVEDRSLRRHLADLMQPVWDEYLAVGATGVTPFATVTPPGWEPPAPPFEHRQNVLLDRIEQVPVVLAVAGDLELIASMDAELDRVGLVSGASIYPFCWSVLLAARQRGLGGVMTTFLSRTEEQARDALGLPPTWAVCATIFLGHPVRRHTKLRRRPVEAFTTLNRFDGEAWR